MGIKSVAQGAGVNGKFDGGILKALTALFTTPSGGGSPALIFSQPSNSMYAPSVVM